ncbi:MAG: pro-sigmaK processing inhibitor BofA family protein [Acutalibacteraceae bacterium]|jgi:pro-sigmaK processing inhibitor BofA
MSVGWQIVWGVLAAGAALAVVIAAFRAGRPIRRLAGSAVQGLCALAAVDVAGAFTGVSLGLNAFTGGCCAVLGIPGVIALLLERLIVG